MKMTATANSFEGETKSGVVNKPGTAADPHIDIYLPSDAAARRFGRREAR